MHFVEFASMLINLDIISKFVIMIDGDMYYEGIDDEFDINENSNIVIAALDTDEDLIACTWPYETLDDAKQDLTNLNNKIREELKG